MGQPASCGKPTEREPLEHSVPRVTQRQGSEQSITDVKEQPEEGEAIVVGAVGSAAPWFLTGRTNNIEVEFMIDTGCQVTILAMSVVERMCAADPQVRSRIRPLCTPVGVGRFFPVNSYWITGIGCYLPGTKVCYVLRGSQYRFRRTAGHGSSTIVPTTSAGSANRPAMGRRSGDITITPTETHPED